MPETQQTIAGKPVDPRYRPTNAIDLRGALRASDATEEQKIKWCQLLGVFDADPLLHQVAEIDERTFDYFLEVLPPVFMQQAAKPGPGQMCYTFGFAEGWESVKGFWSLRTDPTDPSSPMRYFVENTGVMNPRA